MTKGELTKEAFDQLLRWLDSDRDKAASKYERIRLRLIRIFAARGCCDAEDLSDQTINVIVGKIDWLTENYEGEPAIYFYAVAKKIFLEQLKKRSLPPVPPPSPDRSELELQSRCLHECLQRELTPAEQDLVVKYHEGDGQERIRLRKELAKQLGISLNALRIRLFHLLARIRPCIHHCVRKSLDA
jgi:DNA-directed RNA polymerase specialized sigma24 family protein